MSYIDKAGTPFLRYTDPMIPQVNPRGLQPQSSYIAPLAYATGEVRAYATPLAEPPDELNVEILLFGCDYPQRFNITQFYGKDVFDGSGTGLIPTYPSVTVPSLLFDGTYGYSKLPSLLASQVPEHTRYQEKLTGITSTEQVTTTGFPFKTLLRAHNFWASPSGAAGPLAAYTAEVNMAMSSGSTSGPAPFVDFDGTNIVGRQPVILWEPDFTQQVIDDGYKINCSTFNDYGYTFVLDVVGIWCGFRYFDGEPIPYSPISR